ncbi:hypothetical protein VHEMI07601 [[Torrubiella] hemipterigena]|uniref:Uncharacterized protein n=1 Tax=[Torrubiella] hemipterigena TaxID=1531966 RepID=A0A0A1TLY2_9HYPO|nr:hypothetical protein VHEMI07601 [[Torrubiella] hemipterigena]
MPNQENWNYADADTGQQLWKTLVAKYLSLAPADRTPYKTRAISFRSACGDRKHRLLAPQVIERVVMAHQTIAERDASVEVYQPRPVLIRTCYDVVLNEKTNVFINAITGAHYGPEALFILDDGQRFDIDGDERIAQRIRQRIPGHFCEISILNSVSQGQNRTPPAGFPKDLDAIVDRMEVFVYVVDKAAVEESLVKVFWFDVYGECLRVSKGTPEDTDKITENFRENYSMFEAVVAYERP